MKNIQELLEQAVEDKNIKALSHLKDFAIHMQNYEIAANVRDHIKNLTHLFETYDGVKIYEGDKFYSVNKSTLEFESWSLVKNIVFTASKTTPEYDGEVYFSSESKALEWIESQKPKEKYLHLGSNTLKITANNVSGLDKLSWLSDDDIDFIYKAMEDLKNA